MSMHVVCPTMHDVLHTEARVVMTRVYDSTRVRLELHFMATRLDLRPEG